MFNVKNSNKYVNKFIEILPGLICCILITVMSKFLGKLIPNIGAASLSIFIGMAIGNTFGNKKILKKGVKFSESKLLSYSIVLLGGTLSTTTLINLGFSGVGYIILQMSVTIIAALIIGKKLGFSQNFRFLMASGNAVCGSSAIAATAPAIKANDDEKALTITIVNITGTVLMLLLPLIAKFAFHTETLKTSAFIGGILQSLGQVVASGSLVNESVKDLATIFKIVRIIFLVFVVLILGNLKNKTSNKYENTPLNTKVTIPWYVIGFFIMCALFSLGIISRNVSMMFKVISSNFEIIALAGIGMSVNFKELIKQGAKASIYALTLASVQIISALLLIFIFL